jgi:penicillin-binding protein 1B
MKRAVALPEYHDAKEFAQPSGVIDVNLDKASNLLSTPACPDDYNAAFIAGTEPTQNCEVGKPNFLQRMLGLGNSQAPPPIINGQSRTAPPATGTNAGVQNQQQPQQPQKEEKKGFWGKVVGVFKGDEKKPEPQKSTPPPPH